MNRFDLVLVVINGVGAAVAGVVTGYAAVRSAYMRGIRAAICAYSMLYAGAYAYLLGTQDIVPWSKVMRGVSVVAWPLVWIAPHVFGLRVTRQIVDQLEALTPDTDGDQVTTG
jgi:hypothetical protein